MLLNRVSSFTTVQISCAPDPWGSRMDSALSRAMTISFEDKYRRKGTRSSGFSMPAPMTLESRRRKFVREAGNSSQRMNQRLSPNRCLMRLSLRTVRMMDVLPIPPVPSRAIGVRRCARSTILSINSSRPKILGGCGGSSPGALDVLGLSVVGIVDLF